MYRHSIAASLTALLALGTAAGSAQQPAADSARRAAPATAQAAKLVVYKSPT